MITTIRRTATVHGGPHHRVRSATERSAIHDAARRHRADKLARAPGIDGLIRGVIA
jgi:hypothetical protein